MLVGRASRPPDRNTTSHSVAKNKAARICWVTFVLYVVAYDFRNIYCIQYLNFRGYGLVNEIAMKIIHLVKLIDNTLFCKKKEIVGWKYFSKVIWSSRGKNCDVHCQFLGPDFPRSLHPFLTRSTKIDRKNEQGWVSLQFSPDNLECNFELHLSKKIALNIGNLIFRDENRISFF